MTRMKTASALPADLIDVRTLAAELAGQARTAPHGHAQRTLYRNGPARILMFALPPGGALPAHSVAGVVSVQVLDGRVTMTAGGERFELAAGTLLQLPPGLPHDLVALDAAVVLVQLVRTETRVA